MPWGFYYSVEPMNLPRNEVTTGRKGSKWPLEPIVLFFRFQNRVIEKHKICITFGAISMLRNGYEHLSLVLYTEL